MELLYSEEGVSLPGLDLGFFVLQVESSVPLSTKVRVTHTLNIRKKKASKSFCGAQAKTVCLGVCITMRPGLKSVRAQLGHSSVLVGGLYMVFDAEANGT